jgi:hypothetical protein
VSQQNRKKSGLTTSIVISLVLILVAYIFIANRQRVIDQVTVWQFHPSAEVSGLVDRAGMNDNGKFYYLASQPKLDGTSNFNKECDRVESTVSILGCYSNSRIYIYDVTDKQLDGVREVTAAHETLHVIYARMSDDDKKKVNALIESEYAKLSSDKAFSDLVAFYDRTEPGQRDNELHSIIGTEVASLDPALESHYDQYFTNRQNVVALNSQYSSVFKSLKARADDLSAQLDVLSATITSRSAQYNTDVNTLNSDVSAFNARAASGGFYSQAQFNMERAALTQRLADLQTEKSEIDSLISQYKTMLDEYNSLASQSKKLYSIIDSTLAPAPTLK